MATDFLPGEALNTALARCSSVKFTRPTKSFPTLVITPLLMQFSLLGRPWALSLFLSWGYHHRLSSSTTHSFTLSQGRVKNLISFQMETLACYLGIDIYQWFMTLKCEETDHKYYCFQSRIATAVGKGVPYQAEPLARAV